MGLAHAKLSPSGASRWILCPASVSMTEKVKRTSNPSARLGTFTHLVGELLIEDKEVNVGDELHCEWETGSEICTKEMLHEATNYARYVKDIATRDSNSELIVEKTVDISYIYPRDYLIDMEQAPTGHADAVVIENDTLHIIDLKTGANLVNAENNSQLKIYAYGCYIEYALDYDIKKIELHIVQDNIRTGGNRTNSWETTPELIEEWVETVVKPSAKNALSDNPVCNAGEKQCQWCEASSWCEEANRYANELIGDLFGDDDIPQNKKEAEESGKILPLEKVIKFIENFKFLNRLNDVYENRIFDELYNGNTVDGYKLVKKITRRKWTNEIEAFDKLKTWALLDDIAPRSLLTPSQAEKVLGDMSSKKKNIFNSLISKPEGGLTFAPVSDKRPAETVVNGDMFDDDEDLSFLD